uniref:protein-tyrosine-phosphatase n=1 Tax=Cacopsylla melanoneura TaxID=428564 RepID=A0A8D8W7Y1_9HEMI
MTKVSPLEGHDIKDLVNLCEIQKDRLYFASFKTAKQRLTTTKTHFFSSDETYVYLNFFGDFGPICLSTLYRYCDNLKKKLNLPTLKHKVIIHYTGPNPKNRVNAAFLIGCYAIIYLKWNPNQVYREMQANNKVPYIDYQDASEENSKYTLSLLDCFNAVYKAHQYNFFDFDDFDMEEMEKYEKIQFGDISWMVPNKFLAFSGPNTAEHNTCYHPPEFYLEYFLKNGVQLVVRLNQRNYDESKFTTAGIDHVDFYFLDGTPPPNDILCNFMKICERYKGPIAVHCKAGLGRTGCLIGAYLIKHYKMSAMETIAWMRICRPGCVIGIQQDWLKDVQTVLLSVGEKFRTIKQRNTIEKHPYGIYSKKQKMMASPEPRPITSRSRSGLKTNKENSLLSNRAITAPPVLSNKRDQKNFVQGNMKKPLSTLGRPNPVTLRKWKPESQADSLMLVKTNKARKFIDTIPNKI